MFPTRNYARCISRLLHVESRKRTFEVTSWEGSRKISRWPKQRFAEGGGTSVVQLSPRLECTLYTYTIGGPAILAKL